MQIFLEIDSCRLWDIFEDRQLQISLEIDSCKYIWRQTVADILEGRCRYTLRKTAADIFEDSCRVIWRQLQIYLKTALYLKTVANILEVRQLQIYLNTDSCRYTWRQVQIYLKTDSCRNIGRWLQTYLKTVADITEDRQFRYTWRQTVAFIILPILLESPKPPATCSRIKSHT